MQTPVPWIAWQPAAATEPHDVDEVESQMSTQYVGVVAPLTSRTHWPVVAAGTPGGMSDGQLWPEHFGEQRSPEMPVMDTFISFDLQPVDGSPYE